MCRSRCDREAAGHASDIPFFMNTQALKYGAKTTDRDNAAGRVVSRFVVDFVKAAPKDPQLQVGRATSVRAAR